MLRGCQGAYIVASNMRVGGSVVLNKLISGQGSIRSRGAIRRNRGPRL